MLFWGQQGFFHVASAPQCVETLPRPSYAVLFWVVYYNPLPKNHNRPKKELHWSPWVKQPVGFRAEAGEVTLRVQVPNNHILPQNLYYNYYYPKPKYLIIGYMDPLGKEKSPLSSRTHLVCIMRTDHLQARIC